LTYGESYAIKSYRNADKKEQQAMFKEHLKELLEKQRQKEENAKG
jgi:hypothetical protein